MNDKNEIKEMIGVMVVLGIAMMLLLVIMMMGYNYLIIRLLAGICMFLFIFSGIALVKLKSEE